MKGELLAAILVNLAIMVPLTYVRWRELKRGQLPPSAGSHPAHREGRER